MPKEKEAEIIPLAARLSSLVREFEPTERQVHARRAIRVMVDSGTFSPIEWLAEFRKPKANCLMTSDEWREWMKDPGFDEWFYKDLYPKVTHHDLAAMGQEWMQGLRKSISAGNPQAIKFFYEEVIQKSGSGETSGIVEIIKSTNKWKTGGGR